MSLRKQALNSMVWSFAQQFSNQIVSFIISVVLARILLPSDFGTIALFGVVMGIGSYLVDGGMASSLVRTKDTTERDLSTVFWFNIGIGFLMYIIIFLTAPLVAAFYKLDILTPIIRVYCLVLIIDSFVNVQRAHFIKELDFKTSFKIKLPSLIIGGIAGISFAYNGFGVWSLVYFALIQSFISTLQYWLYSDWKPKVLFDKKRFKYHFVFGYRLTAAGLLTMLFNNVYTIIIGKVFSASELGYYNRADSLKQLPVSNISNALSKVTFPLFAKISDDDGRLREVYERLLKMVILIIAPVLCLMIVIAEPFISFLLTDKWLPAVPYFQILALAGILYPIHSYNINVLEVKGRSDLVLKLEIIKNLLATIILFISIKFGIVGIAWGIVIGSVLAFYINTYYVAKFINYTALEQIKDLLPSILLAACVGGAFYLLDISFLNGLHNWVRLLIVCIGYGLFYLGLAKLFKFESLDYAVNLLLKR